MKKLSAEATKLLQYAYEHKDSVCNGLFSTSLFSSRKVIGQKTVREITPFVEELVQVKVFKEVPGILRAPRYQIVQKYAEKYIQDIEDEKFSQEYREAVEDEIRGYKKFVITTAVMEKSVNKSFVDSIKNYAERNKALLLVLPCEDVASRSKKGASIELSPELENFRVIFKDTYLNNNLCLCAIKVSAKQMDPLRGLDRLTSSRNTSIIVAAPKIFMRYVPNMHLDIPPALMSTGAVTINDYDTDRYMSKRTSTLAENDHTYGAVIVEVESDRVFHFRHIEASKNGSFVDLGVEYLPDGTTQEVKDTVMVMGDSHVGYHDLELHEKTMELAAKTNVSTVILHDIFHGSSISHHDWNKSVTRARQAQEGKLGLERECIAVKSYLKDIESRGYNVEIVDSNHDNFLMRYLEEGRYVTDPMNHKFALKLAVPAIEGMNPLKYAIESVLGFVTDKVRWMEKDKSYKFYGVEVGLHGAKGANGGRGNARTFNNGIGNCVTAHTHSASILRNTYCVGTVGHMDMGYNEGLSSWTRTCCLIYSNGTKQLINFIPDNNGDYTYRI